MLEDLKKFMGDDESWSNVRDLSHYDIVYREYSFGTRKTLTHKSFDQYHGLQSSRGIAVSHADTVDSILERTSNDILTLSELDTERINEISRSVTFIQGEKTFVEIGFRTPKLMKHYIDNGWYAKGFDIAMMSVEVAKGLGYDAEQYDFNDCTKDLNIGKANLIVCYHVLEHISDPSVAIRKIYEACPPSVMFHVEVPIEEDGPRLRYGHMFPFHRNDLRTMLTEAGFTICLTSTSTGIERYMAMK